MLITGAAGFLGARLAQALLAAGVLRMNGAAARPIRRLVLLNQTSPAGIDDARVDTVCGDLGDSHVLHNALDARTEAVFHLAAVVSAQAEADFALACASIPTRVGSCWSVAASSGIDPQSRLRVRSPSTAACCRRRCAR